MATDLWFAFFIAALLISISPGAGAVNTMSNGLQFGLRGSLPAILGLQLGYGAQIMLVGIGLGAILASSDLLFEILKWVGVSYLIWLGYQRWNAPPLELQRSDNSKDRRQFWQAAWVNLTNPKATLFLLALFPQFIDHNNESPLQLWIMGTTLIVVDIVVMVGYASLAAQLARLMQSEQQQRIMARVFGGMFIGAACLMASFHHAG